MTQQWHVPSGTASSPRAKLLYRLGAPQRWWSQSILRIVAQEILAFPRRISAALRTPHLRLGYSLLSSRGHRSMSPCEVSEFVHACSNDMQSQRADYPWLTTLDCEMLSQSYRLGAEWAFDTIDRNAHPEAVCNIAHTRLGAPWQHAAGCDHPRPGNDVGASESGHGRGTPQ